MRTERAPVLGVACALCFPVALDDLKTLFVCLSVGITDRASVIASMPANNSLMLVVLPFLRALITHWSSF